jgi:hypothetical protein
MQPVLPDQYYLYFSSLLKRLCRQADAKRATFYSISESTGSDKDIGQIR